MTRFTLTTSLAIAAFAGMTTLASAYDSGYRTNTPRIDATQAHQKHEIDRGFRSGKLTWREYFGLKREQQHIESLESRAKSDGVVTYRERQAIREAQTEAQKHIYKETHDPETRRHSRWRWYR